VPNRARFMLWRAKIILTTGDGCGTSESMRVLQVQSGVFREGCSSSTMAWTVCCAEPDAQTRHAASAAEVVRNRWFDLTLTNPHSERSRRAEARQQPRSSDAVPEPGPPEALGATDSIEIC